MLAGLKGRAVGESGELDTLREKGKGLWGVECTLAVTGVGGPQKNEVLLLKGGCRLGPIESTHLGLGVVDLGPGFAGGLEAPPPPAAATLTKASGREISGQSKPGGGVRSAAATPLAMRFSYHSEEGKAAMEGCMRYCVSSRCTCWPGRGYRGVIGGYPSSAPGGAGGRNIERYERSFRESSALRFR
eukprot:949610-Prorocentrum_minimum.AAC.1